LNWNWIHREGFKQDDDNNNKKQHSHKINTYSISERKNSSCNKPETAGSGLQMLAAERKEETKDVHTAFTYRSVQLLHSSIRKKDYCNQRGREIPAPKPYEVFPCYNNDNIITTAS
jgi:hypothetical protein